MASGSFAAELFEKVFRGFLVTSARIEAVGIRPLGMAMHFHPITARDDPGSNYRGDAERNGSWAASAVENPRNPAKIFHKELAV